MVCSLFVVFLVVWYLVSGIIVLFGWALFVFRCLGKAAALKLRFGSGFTFTVSIGSSLDNETEQRAMHEYVLSMFPSALLLSEPIAGTSQYEIHRSEVVLSDVFARMEDEAVVEKYSITDWAITETTLDECFLKVSGGWFGLAVPVVVVVGGCGGCWRVFCCCFVWSMTYANWLLLFCCCLLLLLPGDETRACGGGRCVASNVGTKFVHCLSGGSNAMKRARWDEREREKERASDTQLLLVVGTPVQVVYTSQQ